MSSGPTDPVAAALARDLDAGFADLVRGHRDLLYSVARSLTGGPADAEDLAADTLLRAYRALRGWPSDRIEALAVRPWLLTALRNTARNRIRDAGRRPAPPPAFLPAAEHASGEPGPDEHAEGDEAQGALGRALAELSEVQRLAVVLRHVQGLPIGEVAQVLGCREGTTKSHISRGLTRLRSVLTPPGERTA